MEGPPCWPGQPGWGLMCPPCMHSWARASQLHLSVHSRCPIICHRALSDCLGRIWYAMTKRPWVSCSRPHAAHPLVFPLPSMQWRALEEARHAEGQAAVTAILHSAYRAQLATPACRQR